MSYRHARSLTLCSWLACLVTARAAAGAPLAAPADTAALVQKLYQHTADLKGKFKQVYTDRLYGRNRVSYGYFYVKKPGMMRWNYVQPEAKSFISDGKLLWVYEPLDHQAFRNPLDGRALASGLPFLLGSGNLAAEFTIEVAREPAEKLGSPDQQVLKLVPKQPTAQYDYLLLVVRPADGAVTESMLVSKHNTNHMIFSELVFNSRVQTHRFSFRPDPSTRVIDGTKLAQP